MPCTQACTQALAPKRWQACSQALHYAVHCTACAIDAQGTPGTGQLPILQSPAYHESLTAEHDVAVEC